MTPRGALLFATSKTNENCSTLAYIYAPNEYNPAFFLDFFDHLTNFKGDDIIIGDYNLVLDLDIVNKGEWLGSPANIKGVNKDAKI